MNNQQLEYSKKLFDEFIIWASMVSEIFEIEKCYQMKSRNKVYLGRFERVAIDIESFSVAIVFETFIRLKNNKKFDIIDNGRVFISVKLDLKHYDICEVDEEHFLNIQKKVIGLQFTEKQLIKEFTQKQPKIDNSIFTAV